jgi:glucose/arabinose dehydrogenase
MADSTDRADVDSNRRRFLKTVGAMGVVGAAGCLGDDGGESDTPTESPDRTSTGDAPTTTDTSTTESETKTKTDTRTPTPTPQEYAVLVLSVTDGERRDAVPDGNDALEEIGAGVTEQPGIAAFTVDVIDSATTDDYESEIPSDAEAFAEYDAVVFQNTTGTVLNADQRSAFREYVENGGGFIGIHAAAETHTDWGWYENELLGTLATGSSPVEEAEVHVTDRTHAATEQLPARWTREDQWYDFAETPRGDVHVLATLDERTYSGGMNAGFGRDHPIAWCQSVDKGRAIYTGVGHTTAAFSDEDVRTHLKGALLWAVGHAGGSAYGTVWDAYETDTFYQDVVEPMEIQVTPDGRVVYVERTGGDFGGPSADRPNDHGAVKVVDPGSGAATTALELPIFLMQGTSYPKESGLLGLTLDPDFADNGWLYLFYTTETDDGVINRISRFTLDGESIDPDTETVIVDIPHFGLNHQAGSLDFDSEGNLYIATGDDTTPFESSGYAPIDERDGRRNQFDAQRSSGNTNDLRGSILRITPKDDGGYTVPDDNLFTEAHGYGDVDDSLVKKEIWAMGFRNPFTLKIDRETDVPYLADYGPDAGNWDASRGPPGQTSFNQLDDPGFYGWPYFKGPSIPYRDYDFATDESGDIFDPDGPTNDSPANDGLQELPAPIGPMVPMPAGSWGGLLDNPPEWDQYMPYDSVDEVPFPQVTGGSPMQGPIYRHREGYAVSTALPRSYEGKIFMMGWAGGWMKYATLDDDGDVMEVDPFLPDADFSGPQDMTVGPDGSLYVLEWGGTYGSVDPQITRITPSDDVFPVSLSLNGGPFSGNIRVTSRVTRKVSATLTNDGSAPITNGSMQLDARSSDISISESGGTSFDSLGPGETQTAEWSVTLSGDIDSGSYSLNATATVTSGGTEFTVTDSAPFTVE